MVLPQDILWGRRAPKGLPTCEGLTGAGDSLQTVSCDRVGELLPAVARKLLCPLLKVFPRTACWSPQHGSWIAPKQASNLRDSKMEDAFLFPSLGSPIPFVLWCPIGNRSRPCSLWVVSIIQRHQYQEARILRGCLGGLATTEGHLFLLFFVFNLKCFSLFDGQITQIYSFLNFTHEMEYVEDKSSQFSWENSHGRVRIFLWRMKVFKLI